MKKSLLISSATRKNWIRLNIIDQDSDKKLKSRANKTKSEKRIIPGEYFSNRETIQILDYILSLDFPLESIIYSLALNLLIKNSMITCQNGKTFTDNKYVQEILDDFSNQDVIGELLSVILPSDEIDYLGFIYQCLSTEGDKNIKGSYYTPINVIEKCLQDVGENSTFLDPCCGGGSFLICASKYIKDPKNIYGYDIDKIACFIAKINLLICYKDKVFRPNIYNKNFLECEIDKKFDIIATNPPWGAKISKSSKKYFSEILSNESFSLFIVKSSSCANENAKIRFVLPESILNVKTHQDVRQFILNNFHIKKIENLGAIFSGVMSNVVLISLDKDLNNTQVKIIDKNFQSHLSQKFYDKNINNNFSILSSADVEIINKIYSHKYKTLDKASIWALGIVTGDNSKWITNNKEFGEKIYSGKNIQKGFISESDKYIDYKRENFQQVAAESIYRAGEKLVYKFISKRLVFAYDDNQRLFLNSANVLIPKLDGYSIKQVMAFLNSTLFQYIYQKTMGELKVLKGNLMQLPFPDMNFDKKEEINDEEIFKLFKLSSSEISYIKQEVK